MNRSLLLDLIRTDPEIRAALVDAVMREVRAEVAAGLRDMVEGRGRVGELMLHKLRFLATNRPGGTK